MRGSFLPKTRNMKTYALDFETVYTKTVSIKTLGPRGYFSHPEFDAYLMTVVGEDGYVFAGHPKDFDWQLLAGQQIVAHNASFDESLYLYGVTQNWWENVEYAEWQCTADLTSYCKLPRALKGAAKEVLGIEADKSTRDNMLNLRWENMSEEFRKEVTEYAIKDSELCLQLWQKLSHKWPEHERKLSQHTRMICRRGIPIDTEMLQKNLQILKIKLFEAEQAIPWAYELTPLSRKGFNAQCRKQNVEPPVSMAKNSPEASEWLAAHQVDCPWAVAVSEYRRINALLKKLESFEAATMDDGRYYGGLLYFGAHSGRWSGSGGNLNLQNLPRDEMFGVNLRKMIATKDTHRLIVADLSQIEVRTLSWLADDKEMLDRISKTADIYEAFAVMFGLFDPEKAGGSLKKKDPDLRHVVKAMALAAGYGVGPAKLTLMYGLTPEKADWAVQLYRSHMPAVLKLWKAYERGMNGAYATGVPFALELPSGREMDYGMLTKIKTKFGFAFKAQIRKQGRVADIFPYAGFLAENASQALARDIFSDMLLRIEEAGYKIIFHVHDEVIVEVPAEEAEAAKHEIDTIMATPPKWISDIPLASESHIYKVYEK